MAACRMAPWKALRPSTSGYRWSCRGCSGLSFRRLCTFTKLTSLNSLVLASAHVISNLLQATAYGLLAPCNAPSSALVWSSEQGHVHIPSRITSKGGAYRCVAMAEEGCLHNARLRSFMCMGEGCILDSILAQGCQDSGAGPQHGSASARPAAGWLQHLKLLQAAGMQRVLQESAVLPCSLHTLHEACTQCMP